MLRKIKNMFGVERVLWHDLETFSKAPLLKVGAAVYAEDPSTEIILGAYSFDLDTKVTEWDKYAEQVGDVETPTEPPQEYLDALTDPKVLKVAHNASFEYTILSNVQGVKIPHDQTVDSMILAFYLSFPGKLEKIGGLVGLPSDKQKDKDGKRLIRTFSVPAKPLKRNPDRTRIWPKDKPADWFKYRAYNRQDVSAMRDIFLRMFKYAPPLEIWQQWWEDRAINERGVPVNQNMARRAMLMYDRYMSENTQRMRELTGLANPNSRNQLLDWLADTGEYVFDNLRKASVAAALREEHLIPDDPVVKEVLETRRELAKTSVTKYRRFRDCVAADSTIKQTLQFGGAMRTLRWGGRLIQPQNMKNPSEVVAENMPLIAKLIEAGEWDALEAIRGDVMAALSEAIRGCIQAPPGYLICDADLSAIENVVLGYASGDQKILEVFRTGKDPYISFAQYMYHESYDDLWNEYKVERNGKKRKVSKPAVLGCPRGDTLVLTDSGWKRLDCVQLSDKVHDGLGFVEHDGVVSQGIHSCQTMSGVVITPDHEIYTDIGTWKRVKDLGFRDWNTATNLAAGLLFDTSARSKGLDKSTNAFVIAAHGRSKEVHVYGNLIGRNATASSVLDELQAGPLENVSVQEHTTFWLTDTTRSADGARATTPGMGDAASKTVSTTSKSSSNTASKSSGTLQPTRSTGSITTDITSGGIYAPLLDLFRTPTEKTAIVSLTGEGLCAEPSSGKDTLTSTRAPAQFYENSAKGKPPPKSFKNNRDVGAYEVFDIQNAGPSRRFVILTEDGPVIIHNCGYRLGAGHRYIDEKSGEEEATGLLGYAKAMGIELTDEEAETSVKVWRATYSDAVKFWYDLERAAFDTLRTGKVNHVGPVSFDIKGKFLRLRLPSGRHLHYYKAHIRAAKTPWGEVRDNVHYYGLKDQHWCLQSTHGGKFTENICQAIARDLLQHGISLALKENLDIFLHVHDQILILAPEDKAEAHLKILMECMNTRPKWAPDIPLATGGFITTHMTKD